MSEARKSKKIRVVELFAGSATFTGVARSMGMETLSTDNVQYGNVDLVGDILSKRILREIVKFAPDAVWASSPCTGFSIASVSHHFTKRDGQFVPKSSTAALGMALAIRVFEIARAVRKETGTLPVVFMENPVGVLGKMPFMDEMPVRHKVTFCRYGHEAMKPTHIWCNCRDWVPRPCCRNGGWGKAVRNGVTWCLDESGALCHMEARRGAKTGTQGRSNAHERAKLPEPLCEEILQAMWARVLQKRRKSLG